MKLADKSVRDIRVQERGLRKAFEIMSSSEGGIDWSTNDVSLEVHDNIALIQDVRAELQNSKNQKRESKLRRRNY